MFMDITKKFVFNLFTYYNMLYFENSIYVFFYIKSIMNTFSIFHEYMKSTS